jgi:hypothetical protein
MTLSSDGDNGLSRGLEYGAVGPGLDGMSEDDASDRDEQRSKADQ